MKHISKIVFLVSGISLGILFSLATARLIENSLLSTKKLSLAAAALSGQISDRSNHISTESSPSELADSIIVDAILTIIQSYYVDEARVTNNEQLLKGLVDGLVDRDQIDVKRHSKFLYALKNGDAEILIDFNSYINYDLLLSHTMTIIGILNGQNEAESSEVTSTAMSAGAFKALNTMMHALDPHSSLMNDEEYRELKQGTEGAFGGLGVVVGIQDNVLTVIKPLPSSPAAKAGITGQDRIVFINDHSTFGTSLQSLVKHMRGEPGTEVNLSLLRDGEEAPRQLKIKREIINVNSVERSIERISGHALLKLKIESFSSRTAEEIITAIDWGRKHGDVDGLIIDLRDNPGGLLDQAVKASDVFLSEGRIVSTSGRRPEVELAYQDSFDTDLPIVVLVNGQSASASEILAGALQDNNRAVVLGEPTFGKGSVQTVFELPADHALKLTIARYYTPNGGSIQNHGIMPDIWAQEIETREKNENLFGYERYANERYLSNSLQNIQKNRHKATHKYYFIRDKKGDHELELAKKVFQSFLSKKTSGEQTSFSRASYLLAQSQKYLAGKTLKEEAKVARYLRDQHKLNWFPSTVRHKNLKLELSFKNKRSLWQVKQGQTVPISWKIRNPHQFTVKNLSIYLTSPDLRYPAKEILIGDIEPGERISGELSFQASLPARKHPYLMSFGITQGAHPVPLKQKTLRFKVRDIVIPAISHRLKLLDEEGGDFQGILEPDEDAYLELIVENLSDVDAHSIVAKISNFSGSQIQLKDEDYRISKLPKNTKKRIRIPVKGSKFLRSKRLHFGLSVESEELLDPLTKNYFVNARPAYEK